MTSVPSPGFRDRSEDRGEISGQIREFLKRGGKINCIPAGVGVYSQRPVHMTREQWVASQKKTLETK